MVCSLTKKYIFKMALFKLYFYTGIHRLEYEMINNVERKSRL